MIPNQQAVIAAIGHYQSPVDGQGVPREIQRGVAAVGVDGVVGRVDTVRHGAARLGHAGGPGPGILQYQDIVGRNIERRIVALKSSGPFLRWRRRWPWGWS